MTSYQHDALQTQSTWGFQRKALHLLEGLTWCEVFVWLGLHCFWVLIKSSPLGVDNPQGALLALWPFVVMLIAGLLSLDSRGQSALIRLEAALHWSACLFQAILLYHVVWQNPMQPILPLASSMYLWSCGLTFILLAGLATHLRKQTHIETSLFPVGPWFIFVSLIVWWGVSLWLASGMTWVVYFWTASIFLHGAIAPLSLRHRHAESVRVQRRASLLEPYFVLVILFLIQLRGIHSSAFMGGLEEKYPLYLQPFRGTEFFLGAGFFLLAVRFHFTAFAHAAVTVLILITDKGQCNRSRGCNRP